MCRFYKHNRQKSSAERFFCLPILVVVCLYGCNICLWKKGVFASKFLVCRGIIDPLHDPVTWYGINYTGTQITQWDFQNKGTHTIPARLSFVLKVPLRNLRPSVIYSLPCDRIVQRVYLLGLILTEKKIDSQ